ncbi:uncharacterized protein LOC124152410 [Haliotis rufescens]|uniref:uncharacterized protein LOC124152410 n=1 Tax=Haliotis rufescens TaxID=6454 RepID=UPI001EAFF41F|nr:uncharacterized protein LOC124152410 [Haliotis rufescens]XP_046381297.1 uncharacterized protein LOC124152410 [Haliotis rufescens]XP_046381299.1 uncharacterized protein LOC124152410 [Haliotis rufescens]XP_046381301.1 uncharacterized protein LOC124152410 [Haliotis rufescens]XP_048245298.1 uncharacterized protein LOC124152410 [Haliotis rufescens]
MMPGKRTFRLIFFIIIGGMLTFGAQRIMYSSPKLDINITEMTQQKSHKPVPVIPNAPPIVPLPGGNMQQSQQQSAVPSVPNQPPQQLPVNMNNHNMNLQALNSLAQTLMQYPRGNAYQQQPNLQYVQAPQMDPAQQNSRMSLLNQFVQTRNMMQQGSVPNVLGAQGYQPNPTPNMQMQGPYNMAGQQIMPAADQQILPVAGQQIMPVAGQQNIPASGQQTMQMAGAQIPNNMAGQQNLQMTGVPNPNLGDQQNIPLVTSPKVMDVSQQVPVQTGPETTILRWNGSGWTQLHQFCAGSLNLKRTMLKSPVGNAVIYIHDLKDDKWVSGSLKLHGLWDLPDVKVMIDNLRSDPEMGFIDIGSHVGTFSIVAALMGKKVVAVDPLVANVIRFCKSVQDNRFTDKITIFYTAISDSYKKVSFVKDIGNIGGTRIKTAPSNVNTSNVYDPNFIDTVRLDDLVPHIPFKRAFIKMDVEEHEYQVITSGVKFFQQIDVRGILMEWMWQKTGPNGLRLRDYLLALGFAPFRVDGSSALPIDQYKLWPNDVLWMKLKS